MARAPTPATAPTVARSGPPAAVAAPAIPMPCSIANRPPASTNPTEACHPAAMLPATGPAAPNPKAAASGPRIRTGATATVSKPAHAATVPHGKPPPPPLPRVRKGTLTFNTNSPNLSAKLLKGFSPASASNRPASCQIRVSFAGLLSRAWRRMSKRANVNLYIANLASFSLSSRPSNLIDVDGPAAGVGNCGGKFLAKVWSFVAREDDSRSFSVFHDSYCTSAARAARADKDDRIKSVASLV
ncbi:hypothetical protein BDZ91DRAFT_738262 [Kalaharituber pfeilii]|nr:hypothetical protein BDZ91DRAFT_738262 [Kalaharituber pfeilii]